MPRKNKFGNYRHKKHASFSEGAPTDSSMAFTAFDLGHKKSPRKSRTFWFNRFSYYPKTNWPT
jgi:hypothetical protein